MYKINVFFETFSFRTKKKSKLICSAFSVPIEACIYFHKFFVGVLWPNGQPSLHDNMLIYRCNDAKKMPLNNNANNDHHSICNGQWKKYDSCFQARPYISHSCSHSSIITFYRRYCFNLSSFHCHTVLPLHWMPRW